MSGPLAMPAVAPDPVAVDPVASRLLTYLIKTPKAFRRQSSNNKMFSTNTNGDPPQGRNPITFVGYQIAEYLRRMSDYIYYFVSGMPPITRQHVNSRRTPEGKPSALKG
ncbi:uncharacterized protein LOC143017602 [Oratosquilla oratoria]|uniref:uncharacterized protein LOC143017602 n=1 Tax=Oratosquilla oratoria TaxID=337810 RepID=UPI003F761F76